MTGPSSGLCPGFDPSSTGASGWCRTSLLLESLHILPSFEPTLKTENMLHSSCHTCKQTQWAVPCIQDNHRTNTILNIPGNLLLPQYGWKRCKLVFEPFLHKQGKDFMPALFSDPVFTEDFLYTVTQLKAVKFNYQPLADA